MNVDRQNYLQLVDAIRSRNLSKENLDALNSIIAQNGSPQLVDDLVCKEKAVGRDEEDAVSETMRHLESLADTALSLACVLMVHLLPIAGCSFDHDVFDSVGLWICNNPSEELAHQLRLIASAETDSQAKKNYEGLAEFVENAQKGKSPGH
ncbi:MAG TPA: hypothetical protein VHC44_03850 [Verrucomicrobiae bacterium]|nr:hypothetical protein [Verrucomicrobiae bacterium]